MAEYRVGLGWDIHRLEQVAGARLVLAGVEVARNLRAIAHSDGDVVLHALCDALLGARSLGDIGEHFPDSDHHWAGCDSTRLLAAVLALPGLVGWRVENMDVNVLAERPRLGPYKQAMRDRLAGLLGIDPDRIGIKARSKEGCDAVGAGEAIEAQVAVLLRRGGS